MTEKARKIVIAGAGSEIRPAEDSFLFKKRSAARGHEFHYSTFKPKKDISFAYETIGMRGTQKEGFADRDVSAGYTHIHFASNPGLAENWINRCLEWKNNG